jgi:hypothetical protein
VAEGCGVGVGAIVGVGVGEAGVATAMVGVSVGAIVGVGRISAIADGEGPAVVTGDPLGSVPPQPATITSAVASIAIVRVTVRPSHSCTVGIPVDMTVAVAGS